MHAMCDELRRREHALGPEPRRGDVRGWELRMDPHPLRIGESIDRLSPALRTENLCKSYGRTDALTGVSFEVHSGEVFGLLGPNGAGKTTALSIIVGLVRPSSGDAIVFGRRVHESHMMVRPMIGMVSHEVALYPKLSAVENLRFFGHMYGMGAAELERRIDELLELVGLVGRRRDYAATFSDGMRRRLNLAVSLLHRPQLLLLDEPTAGIDLQSREHIFGILGWLRQEGAAILYTTHHPDDAQRLCDRVAIMDEGRIVATGTPQAVTAQSGCGEVGLEAAFLHLTGRNLRD
jgi:ABC-2 type transport system ATP-binding protein